MKKIILFTIVSISLSFTFCGGKEMNNPADGSDSGPCYRNEGEPPHQHSKTADTDSIKGK
jgi:hypothetical protein